MKDRVIIIGDVHGCLDELQALLKRVAYNKDKDTVVLVGDLVSSISICINMVYKS